MKRSFFFLCVAWLPMFANAQIIHGTVSEIRDQVEVKLPGVNVYWADSEIGIATDENGHFELFKPAKYSHLVFSFVGYKNDTLRVDNPDDEIRVILSAAKELGEVQIVQRQMGTFIDRIAPAQIENITGAELHKAACCNLAESFETNASVDAYYSNAVTGAKQIRLLGLDGTYVQLLTENVPALRGLATPYGLEYIPGPWMEAIQISKGTASVKNGYESVTGQINVEFLKPLTADKAYVNLFASDNGRMEFNGMGSAILSDRLSTLVLAHVNNRSKITDHQNDGFLDNPLSKQYNLMNRWIYQHQRIHVHFGVKGLLEERTTGQTTFSREMPRDLDHPYGIGIDTERYEAYLKVGYTLNNDMNSNFGSIFSLSHHSQESFFGIRTYTGEQLNYYMNLMFQTDVVNEKHNLTTGYSLNYDHYNEILDATPMIRKELVNGVFSEYTFKPNHDLLVQAGLRLDYHNVYGLMFTPRIHARYNLNKHTIFRTSAGKGYKSPNVLAENNHFLANSRTLYIADNLQQEEAWNFGVNLTRYFSLGARELTTNIDFYRTAFVNQILADLDTDVNMVRFIQVDGESFANNYQVEMAYELFKGLDARAAFRYSDVRYELNGDLIEKPLVSKYKGLLTMSYATPLKKWQFDVTTQINGPGRVPATLENPVEYQVPETFGTYVIVNAQITKYFRTWSLYLGSENLTDYTQPHPVIAAEQPFGEHFDASLVWGPLHGRKIYIGMRFGLDRDE